MKRSRRAEAQASAPRGDFACLQRLAEDHYEAAHASHDILHVMRVRRVAEAIGQQEGADLHVLRAAALLHDIVSLPKNHPKREQGSVLAARKARPLLRKAGYDASSIKQIAQVIIEHSYSRGDPPSTKESAVFQDADRLDALGAIGVLRLATCGASMGSSYYHADDPFAERRELDDSRFALDHVYNKLLKLPAQMNTQAGRTEAQRRAAFLEQFLDQLATELRPIER